MGDIQCDICVGCTAQRATGPECDIRENFNMNKYLNIFVSNIFYQQMSEYIRMKKLTWINIYMNIRIENCMNIWIYLNIPPVFTVLHTNKRISDYIHTEKLIRTNVRINISDQNIWIFKYICHTLRKTYSCHTVKFRPNLV